MTPTSVVAVSSSGGVLLDVAALVEGLPDAQVRWVAVSAVDTRARLADADVLWAPEFRWRRPLGVVRATVEAWRRLRADPPDSIVSAGSGAAVPWFLAGRALGVHLVWIETLNLIGDQGAAAALCSRLSSVVVVQRSEQLDRHRRAVLTGELY